jgi:hypothetical protein
VSFAISFHKTRINGPEAAAELFELTRLAPDGHLLVSPAVAWWLDECERNKLTPCRIEGQTVLLMPTPRQ